MSVRPRSSTLVFAALIVVCGLAFYSDSFTDLFIGLDGKESIRDNPHIRHIWPLSEALSLPMWKAPLNLAETPAVANRPTFSISLALTNVLLGFTPRAHHAVNIAIHIAAALVLFGYVRRTLCGVSEASGAKAKWLALAAALIWLVHPLQTESVTYIVQRAESLMGLLLLLTLYCAVRARDSRRPWAWQLGAIAACAAATGCKQTAAVAPFLVLFHDYTFAARSGAKWLRPYFYVALLAAAWAPQLTYARKIGTYLEAQQFVSYALTQPAVILHYLRLTFWPDHLFLYVNTHVFDVASPAQAVVPALVLGALLVATLFLLVRRHWLGFVGAWFFVTLGPTSSFLPISDVIQEHRMYVPLAALAVLVAIGGDWAIARLTPRRSEHARTRLEVGLLAAVVLALGARTYVRNWDYHHEFATIHPADLHEEYTILADHYLDDERLLQAEAVRSRTLLRSIRALDYRECATGARWRFFCVSVADPRDVAFAHFIAGLAAAHAGDRRDAIAELRRTTVLEPRYAYAHHQFGIALRDTGDAAGAIEQFRAAIRLKPNLIYAYKDLAVTLAAAGDAADAEQQLRLVLGIQPKFGEAQFELGILQLRQGKPEEAAKLFEEALRNRPDLVEPHYELAMLDLKNGDQDAAREHFAAAVHLRPEFIAARRELIALLVSMDDRAAAIAELEGAVRTRPELVDMQLQLARLLQADDDLEGARRALRRAARARPHVIKVRHELGRVLLRSNRSTQATRQLRRVAEQLQARRLAHPDSVRAREDLGTAYTELGMAAAHEGDHEAAIAHLTEAIRLQPDSAQAHTELGIALRASGDLKGAIEQLQQAIRLGRGSADAYKALGIMLRDGRDFDRAAASFEKALELQPDYAEAHYELGWVRHLQGNLPAAVEQYKRALAIRPDFPDARRRLADVEAQLARRNAASPRRQ